jgi:hypothetical protein
MTNDQNHTLNHYCLREFCGDCNGFHSRMEGHLDERPWHQDSLEGRAKRIMEADRCRVEDDRPCGFWRPTDDVLLADVLVGIARRKFKGFALTEQEDALCHEALKPEEQKILRLILCMYEWRRAIHDATAEWKAWTKEERMTHDKMLAKVRAPATQEILRQLQDRVNLRTEFLDPPPAFPCEANRLHSDENYFRFLFPPKNIRDMVCQLVRREHEAWHKKNVLQRLRMLSPPDAGYVGRRGGGPRS